MMVKLQQQQSSRIWLERRSLRVHEKILRVTYIQNCNHVCRRSRIVWEVQCQSRFQWRRRCRKTVNVFGISRASVSAIIKRVSYAITIFLGSESIKIPTTENKAKELTNTLLWTHEFPQCIQTIHDTHTEIVELDEHYLDYINRKSYFSLNVQAVCDQEYFIQNVVIKWPGSVHDSRNFFWILQSMKWLEKGQFYNLNHHSILFKFSYSVILYIICFHLWWRNLQVTRIFKTKVLQL